MAGLLDYLFDPAAYSQTGGLLSRLQPSLASIPQSQGFSQQSEASPIAVGNYQMPRVGDMAQFTPQQADPAALPPNAQPTQGQMPVQEMGFGDRIGAGIRALGNPGGLINRVADFATTLQGGQTPANQTAQYLVGKGLDPALARTVVSDPSLLRAVLPSVLGTTGQTDDIKEYMFAKREDPGLTFQKFMQQKKAVSGEYSLTPQYGTNAKGETVLIQTGKSGEAIETKLPNGVKISSGVDKVDLGTTWGIIDKRTGQLVGQQPKDLQGKEAAEERGKAQGQAQAAVPGAIADAEATKAKIDELIKHEGLGSIVGPLDQYRPTWMLGEKGNDALARYKQLQGQAFLQAYNLLKGGGAITDIEGKKAEAAMARLERAQSEEVFKAALQDFRDAIESGVNKLKSKAAGGQSVAPSVAPAASTNLKAKYGLD